MKLKMKYILLSLLALLFVGTVFAQGPAPIKTPLDPFSLTVLIGGGAVAVKKMRADKKNKKNQEGPE